MTTRAEVQKLDAADPLAKYRAQFDLPEGVLYLDGNSLGPPPKRALEALRQTGEREWGEGLIRSWNEAGWIDLPKTCGAKIAPLIGAGAEEVIVADSVSVNLFKLAAALLGAAPGDVAVDDDEFPTDGYVMEGLARMTGATLVRLRPGDAIPMNVRVLIISLINYKTAAVADMGAVEREARSRNAAVIWDLSHATGLIDVDVKRDGAKFAIGCGYKFLNGGPGAPAFLYVAREEACRLHQPLSGWMGHAAPFDFAPDYRPAAGALRFASGTPPILSLAALDAALDVFSGVELKLVEAKARGLGDLFLERAMALGLKTISPLQGGRRGGHVSLIHENGYAIMQALIARGIIGDFRAPDLMRFGFSPLFLRYTDVCEVADALAEILRTEEWRDPRYARRGVVT